MAQYKHSTVKSGDTILADSWNKMGSKVESINAKFDDEKSVIKGPLTVTNGLTTDAFTARKNATLQGVNIKGGLSVAQNSTFQANVAIPKSRLGVGTQDPKSELEVRGNAKGKVAGTLSVSNYGGANSATSIDFRVYDTGTSSPTGRIKATGANWSNKLEFQTKNPGNRNNPLVTRVAINPNGYVGMGASDPKAPLHIATANDNAIRLQTLDNKWLYTEWVDKDDKRRLWMGLDSNLGKFWIAPENGTKEVVINSPLRAKGNFFYDGQQNKLDVANSSSAEVRVADFKIGHSSRRGSTGRALVDSKTELVVNYGSDWSAGTRIDGKLKVTNNLTVNNAIYAGGSDLYFTQTTHTHTGIGNTKNWAAIENSSNFNALMILGRNTGTKTAVNRQVKVYDDLTVSRNLMVNGQIQGRMWVSKEYSWSQGQSAVRMGPTATTIAFLTRVGGKFEGGGEYVRVYSSGGYWYLGGASKQKDVHGRARCIGKPF